MNKSNYFTEEREKNEKINLEMQEEMRVAEVQTTP